MLASAFLFASQSWGGSCPLASFLTKGHFLEPRAFPLLKQTEIVRTFEPFVCFFFAGSRFERISGFSAFRMRNRPHCCSFVKRSCSFSNKRVKKSRLSKDSSPELCALKESPPHEAQGLNTCHQCATCANEEKNNTPLSGWLGWQL